MPALDHTEARYVMRHVYVMGENRNFTGWSDPRCHVFGPPLFASVPQERESPYGALSTTVTVCMHANGANVLPAPVYRTQ